MAADAIQEYRVQPDALRRLCSLPADFEHDADEHVGTHIGQERAIDAIRFGIAMRKAGYNIYVLGPIGSNRHALIESLVGEEAKARGAPPDWCYVNNFSNPERPHSLRFPAGQGREFREDMRHLIEELQLAIPAAFEGDDYRNQLRAIEEDTKNRVEEQWKSLNERAGEEGIGLLQTPTGYVLAPIIDGKVIDDKEFNKLPKGKREQIEAAIERLSEELQARIEMMPKLRKAHRERVKALDQEVTAHAVSLQLADLKEKYRSLPRVAVYLDDVQENIIQNAQDFQQTETPSLPFLSRDSEQLYSQYEVNLVVDNADADAAPVIYESNPSYPNIIGRVEHRAEMGALVTDFRLVRSGALLQANGGYLILDTRRVLSRPFVWEALKQALFAKQVQIETPAESYGWVSTTTLKPEPIPLDARIILIGERWLYYLLCHYDIEFSSLFKVAADLDDDLERSDDNVERYARLVVRQAQSRELLPFNVSAVQRVIEERARHADDSERLSMHMSSLEDLIEQADYWARERGGGEVDAGDVGKAVSEGRRRLSRLQSRIIDAIKRDTLLIDTSGECVGQVNGLSVTDLGEFRYGHPVRITATTRVGTGDVVDIEREVELGGAIHSKGMMILSSALSARYVPDLPLSLHGSVVFEQSYGGVEGDSASVAELSALLSSLSRLPVRQNIAVTGSVNQLGRVQAVGGVNEKIEGFFDVCRARGLDGSQGVIIPQDNVKHLMLREDVVDAVKRDEFRVFAVRHIDAAIAILTGVDAGERGEDGDFPEGSVNGLVESQLIEYATARKSFAKEATKSGED
ncbi:MAG: AAA family ATPase [Gammaproteobacteria bacterium]|jgi:lon-related putative ATP-dependent protease|nr:AAA family ATPase [Gammaproteobacteria bacterium]MDH3863018.1 AAA family ATPase [Gammaproteobacteria bacterium]MDH4003532.1 AAA family ATPase [Gammaproteobacteria bacterium]NCF60671.1 AAA family ATPase [Gammaproteobacteria bacterium]